ncbi:MAG TPA: hypothetical protein VFU63_01525 [Ktedonobacterales bacterium]|nr:hypothetical protein [Ktedonobacterales bacterium]
MPADKWQDGDMMMASGTRTGKQVDTLTSQATNDGLGTDGAITPGNAIYRRTLDGTRSIGDQLSSKGNLYVHAAQSGMALRLVGRTAGRTPLPPLSYLPCRREAGR